jgi:hypothetical protein
MIEFLFPLFELRIQHTNTFFRNGFVHVFTVPAIIGEFIGVVGVDSDIIHVIAFYAESHGLYMVLMYTIDSYFYTVFGGTVQFFVSLCEYGIIGIVNNVTVSQICARVKMSR